LRQRECSSFWYQLSCAFSHQPVVQWRHTCGTRASRLTNCFARSNVHLQVRDSRLNLLMVQAHSPNYGMQLQNSLLQSMAKGSHRAAAPSITPQNAGRWPSENSRGAPPQQGNTRIAGRETLAAHAANPLLKPQLGAPATAKPSPRPRERPQLVAPATAQRSLQPEALRATPQEDQIADRGVNGACVPIAGRPFSCCPHYRKFDVIEVKGVNSRLPLCVFP
jgi:hypothetical protein